MVFVAKGLEGAHGEVPQSGARPVEFGEGGHFDDIQVNFCLLRIDIFPNAPVLIDVGLVGIG